MNIKNTVENLSKLIDENTKLVQKGSSNSLEKKYFYISKDMKHYIESFCKDQEKDFLEQLRHKKNPSLVIIDAFAGSGVFTLLFTKKVLQTCIDNDITLKECKIYLNDKMYESGDEKAIDSDSLKKNFTKQWNLWNIFRLVILAELQI